MPIITEDYLSQLPPIYRDILVSFPELEPSRKAGYGLAVQTLVEQLHAKYDYGQIVGACQQMADGGAVEIKDRMFVHPTNLGEEIIAGLTGVETAPTEIPPFPIPMKG